MTSTIELIKSKPDGFLRSCAQDIIHLNEYGKLPKDSYLELLEQEIKEHNLNLNFKITDLVLQEIVTRFKNHVE